MTASRRTAFARLAGGVTALVAGWAVHANAAAETVAAGDDWPGAKTTRHRLVVDAFNINDGSPLHFASNFVATDKPGAASVALVLRSSALPIAMQSAIWAKYRIGEALNIIDPETKAPAVKNPFLRPGDEAGLERLLASGAAVGACNVALLGTSRSLAANAGVSKDDAAREWAASLVPGVALLPSGVWGLGRAQEAGCGYCSGG